MIGPLLALAVPPSQTMTAIQPLLELDVCQLERCIEAYANRSSVSPGGTIAFKARHTLGTQSISVPYSIYRVGADESVLASGSVSVTYRRAPPNAYEVGCGWPTTLSFIVPSTWSSGLYVAHFGESDAPASFVEFVVRAPSPSAAILLQVPVTTRQAYNTWGGKSLYDSASRSRSPKVSFDRPDAGDDDTVFFAKEFIRWAERDGGGHGPYQMDYVTSIDLHADPAVPSSYQLLMTVGHDEYWSRAMRDHLDAFVRAGGNAAVFSGNTMYWQVRFEPNSAGVANRTLVCYKDAAADPATDESETVRWDDPEVDYPSNRSIGLGTRVPTATTSELGGIGVYGVFTPDHPNPDPFEVMDGSSWVFAGSGLSTSDQFGAEIIGYETDALLFWVATNRPTGGDQAPNNFQILARANLQDWEHHGWSILGLFDYGGTVFNAGNVDWAAALTGDDDFDYPARRKGEPYDPAIARITENVLTRLSAPRTSLQKNTMSVHRYTFVDTIGSRSYFYSTNPFIEPGSDYDGFAFYAHPAPAPGAVALYQYHTSFGGVLHYRYARGGLPIRGWTLDGAVFYVYAASGTRRVGVYEYARTGLDGGTRYFYSTNSVAPAGWTSNGIAFFVPAGN